MRNSNIYYCFKGLLGTCDLQATLQYHWWLYSPNLMALYHKNMPNWIISRIGKISWRKPRIMLKRLFNRFMSLVSWILNTLQRSMCNWEVGHSNIPFLEQSKDNDWQICTSQRTTVQSWLRRLQMQLMMPVSMSCLSQHRWTTLISVLNLHFSENYLLNGISNIDKI